MTTNVKITWELPTTRESNKPLSREDIKEVDVSLSADGGQNFVLTDTVSAVGVQEVMYPDLVDGDYAVKLVVRLKLGQVSKGAVALFDMTAPNDVSDIVVSFS